MSAGPVALAPGTVFHGRYTLVRCIQAGGMGAVYEVVDQKTRRRRALKVMLPTLVSDADFRARFQREATVTAEIESDHIVETFDADVDAETGAPFIVMELLKGDDLGRLLSRRGSFSTAETVVLLKQAAHALERTHAAGVVHRDLKPENLFLTRTDDGAPKLKVLDFGIAKIVESAGEAKVTRTLGTPLYMAPEQVRGDATIDRRADLFALGHIAYALLAGEAYWTEDAEQTPAMFALFSRMLLGLREPPTVRAQRRRNVALPPSFDGWFLRATAIDPALRFEGATASVTALAGALAVADAGASFIDIAGSARASSQPPSASMQPSGPQQPSGAVRPLDPQQASGPIRQSGPQHPSGAPSGARPSDGPSRLHSGSGSLSVPRVTGRTPTPVAADRQLSGAVPTRRSAWPIAVAVVAVSVLAGLGAVVVYTRAHRGEPAAGRPTESAEAITAAPSPSGAASQPALPGEAPTVSALAPAATGSSAPNAPTDAAAASASASRGTAPSGKVPFHAPHTKTNGVSASPQTSPAGRPPSYDPTDQR